MANFVSAVVGTVTVIAVICHGGFGMHLRKRCVRICEQWNGFPEHLKGFPGNVRQLLSPKSGSQRNYITNGCDCAAFMRNSVVRKKRSIHSSIQPTRPTNSSKAKNISDITKPTSEPSNEPGIGIQLPTNIILLPENVQISNGSIERRKISKPNALLNTLFGLNTSASKCSSDPVDHSVNRTWRAHNISQIRANDKVDFIKNGSDWYANVTWVPPLDKRLYGYLVVWTAGNAGLDQYCKEVLNNQTYMILQDKTDGWEYPHVLHLAVFSLPGYLDITMVERNYRYSAHIPKIDYPDGIPITLEPPIVDNSLKHAGSLLAGVLAGIFLIIVLVYVLYRRKSCGSPSGEGHSIISMQENNNAEGFVKINNTMKPQNNDIYFASYLPENEKFSNEVATIAYKLGTMGYKVTFDKVDSVHMNEIGFNMWVDKQILEAKKYIVFCSPGYVRLWQSLTSSGVDNKFNNVNDQDLVRVRYEIKRISDVYSENCSTSRIVCVKMDPKMTTKQLPPWMNHNMLQWPEQKEDVIRRLNDQAAMVMHV